ncbi:MAG: ABC transporter permease [Bacteroidota bacterium]
MLIKFIVLRVPDKNTSEQLIEWHSYKSTKNTGWYTIFKTIRNYSYFIQKLVQISILKEFKRSYLGLLWLFILPVVAALVWVCMNSAGIINPGKTEVPYPAYVFLSTSIWGFFIEIYKNTNNIFLSGGRMKLMVRFPYEAFIAEKAIVHLLRFTIPFVINLIVLLFFDVRFTWTIFLFPFSLFPLFILGMAIGLLVSIFRVLLEDLAIFADQAMGFLMFLTPVVYAPDLQLGFLGQLIRINPLTYLIGFSRDLLTKGSFYQPVIWAGCILFSFVFFLLTVRIFIIAEPRVIERLIK